MFAVKLLPAKFGDAIVLEYGNENETHRVLIDGGTGGTRSHILAELAGLPADERVYELVVVSHIDRDHIEGILSLLERDSLPFSIGDFWFNGFPHLPDNADDEFFGAVQGERLTAALQRHRIPWNAAFERKAVVVPSTGELPVRALPGGLVLTLLSPTMEGLAKLKPKWEAELRANNLDPTLALDSREDEVDEDESFNATDLPDIDALAATVFAGDKSEANGSSIAFLAEFDGKRALLTGDAHVPVLEAAFDRLENADPLHVDFFKLSHHGSKGTVSKSIIERVASPLYAFSTNGSIFHHPHAESIARVVKGADNPTIVFNYGNDSNRLWDLDVLKNNHSYQTLYPAVGKEGIVVTLSS